MYLVYTNRSLDTQAATEAELLQAFDAVLAVAEGLHSIGSRWPTAFRPLRNVPRRDRY